MEGAVNHTFEIVATNVALEQVFFSREKIGYVFRQLCVMFLTVSKMLW